MATLAVYPRLFELYHLDIPNAGQVSQWRGVRVVACMCVCVGVYVYVL